MSSPQFTGVVLAGGRSTRMGRDKATLTLPEGGTLLAHAVRKLQAAGVHEVIVSVRAGQTCGLAGTREVADLAADSGPLAGVAASLEAAGASRVVVLAVDLPDMTPEYLRGLLAAATNDCGVVPVHGGFLEPLAAVYPRCSARVARAALVAGRFSMHAWVRELAAGGLVRLQPVDDAHLPLFANWNHPGDFPSH